LLKYKDIILLLIMAAGMLCVSAIEKPEDYQPYVGTTVVTANGD